MYLYLLPTSLPIDSAFLVPTPDGGKEHTSAEFRDASAWLDAHHAGSITMFPPQYFLLTLISQHFKGADVEDERRKLLEFVRRVPTSEVEHPTSRIPWGSKVMSPKAVMAYEGGKVALAIDEPGKEVEAQGGGKGGDFERVVIVNLGKGGPWNFGLKTRAEVLGEDKSRL